MARLVTPILIICVVIMQCSFINNFTVSLPSPDLYNPGIEGEMKSTLDAELTTLSTQKDEISALEVKKRIDEIDFGPLGNFVYRIFESIGLSNFLNQMTEKSQLTSENRELTSALNSCQDSMRHLIEKLILKENKLKVLDTEIERLAKDSPLNSDFENLLRTIRNVETNQNDSGNSQIPKVATNSAFISPMLDICVDPGCTYVMKYVKMILIKMHKSPKIFYTEPDSDNMPTKAASVAKNFEQTIPADVPLSKINLLIPYAIKSKAKKIASSNTDQNILFSTNFIGMFFASMRALNQESNLQKLAIKKKIKELEWKSRGNYLQLFAQLGYGYGYWGRYSEFQEYIQYSEVPCDFEAFDLTVKEYREIFKSCDSLDPTMATFFGNELNVKIKKNINCLISHSYENPDINDLVSYIEIFTNVLSENCGA